jgi:hypothetical protein
LPFFEAERMLVAVVDARPTLHPDASPRFFVAYTGTYRFDGVELVTQADDASKPELVVNPACRWQRQTSRCCAGSWFSPREEDQPSHAYDPFLDRETRKLLNRTGANEARSTMAERLDSLDRKGLKVRLPHNAFMTAAKKTTVAHHPCKAGFDGIVTPGHPTASLVVILDRCGFSDRNLAAAV